MIHLFMSTSVSKSVRMPSFSVMSFHISRFFFILVYVCLTHLSSPSPYSLKETSSIVPINLLTCNYRAAIKIDIGYLNLVMQTRITLMMIAFFSLSLSLTWSLLDHCTHVILTKLILGTFYSICWCLYLK